MAEPDLLAVESGGGTGDGFKHIAQGEGQAALEVCSGRGHPCVPQKPCWDAGHTVRATSSALLCFPSPSD